MRAPQAQPAPARPRAFGRAVIVRRGPHRLLATALAVVTGLLLISSSASASSFHVPDPDVTANFGSFHALGLAVDQSSGDVYVSDFNAGAVKKFNADGEPVKAFGGGTGEVDIGFPAWQLAVDQTSHDFYVSGDNHDTVNKFDSEGNPVASFGTAGELSANSPVGVGVDPTNGDLYVTIDSFEEARVKVFTSSGTSITSFSTDQISDPTGVAIDTSGNVYVAGGIFSISGVERFNTSGTPLGMVAEGSFGNVIVDPENEDVYAAQENGPVIEFTPGGEEVLDVFGFTVEAGGVAVNDTNREVYVGEYHHGADPAGVFAYKPITVPTVSVESPTNVTYSSATLNGKVELDSAHGGGNVTECKFEYIELAKFEKARNETTLNPYDEGRTKSCSPSVPYMGTQHVSTEINGLQNGVTYRYRVTAANANERSNHSVGRSLPVPVAVNGVETISSTNVTQESAILHGTFTGEGIAVDYYFEYGTSTNYGHKFPLPPGGPITTVGTQEVETGIEHLVPNTTYHFRLVAENEHGITPASNEQIFTTFRPPTIEGFSTSEVTATSAVLHAKINPQGSPSGITAECRFEYGPTTSYGLVEPCPEPLEGTIGQPVEVKITNLQQGVTYHFRVIAESKWGAVTSEDQTFEFFPPACPNSTVRQQTSSVFLPDCRAYELVSPANANATLLSPGGPNTGQATNPSRLSFTGAYSALPGTNTIETVGDLYVATRTDTDWVSRYVGLPGDQAGCMGGPPTSPNAGDVGFQGFLLTNTVLTDPSMSHFLSFIDGGPIECNGAEIFLEGSYKLDPPSGAPYLFSSDGALEGRLPTDVDQIPGALEAFQCPYEEPNAGHGECTGETTASGDLTHLVFSSRKMAFTPGGLTEAPGSAYVENLLTGTISLISKLPGTKGGGNIPQDPSFATVPRESSFNKLVPGGKEEFIRFPAVSTDGSHILMSTATRGTESCALTRGPYGGAGDYKRCRRFTENPVHLYMRVNDEITYEIAESPTTHEPAAVNYVGMTPDGSEVFFTSAENLTSEETDTDTELYMWSQMGEEKGHPLTRISKPDDGAANTDECHPALVTNSEGEEVPWTDGCDTVPVSTYSWSNQVQSRGGNGISDTAIASQNGDIYFYSPKQLDGDHGVLGGQNLYDYRGGEAHYVTTLTPELRCSTLYGAQGACSEGPILRIDVSPDDSHMAFLTASRLTPYDNAGHPEMYSYTLATGIVVCDSCNPGGKPATSDVEASQDGLFMTDDGRTFFSTTERLVPRDTNEGVDVYEFTSSRPQLITPGTGTGAVAEGSNAAAAGLVGVSANGTDIYFSTFDSLISEDHNGNFLKFYDARSGGGFLQPQANQPCAAAEECHGPGTEAPRFPTPATVAALAGGNATSGLHKHRHRKHRKKAKHHHRRPGDKHGGAS